ncbi:MAG: FkbM family methyltransferase [Chloroflexia bacterium]
MALGRYLGWPLPGGHRIRIHDSQEGIQRRILSYGAYEPGIVELLQKILAPGEVFVDVGANIGQHAIIGAGLGAFVYAIEPVPRLARRVQDNLTLNRLQRRAVVSEVAFTNYAGESVLYLAKRGDDGSHSLLDKVPAEHLQPLAVKTTTLEKYVHDVVGRQPHVVKIDVEGCEALVLDGARSLLDATMPPAFIVETGDRLADELGESALSVLNRFFTRGFRVFTIEDRPFSLIEVSPHAASGELANYLAIHESAYAYARLLSLLDNSAHRELVRA